MKVIEGCPGQPDATGKTSGEKQLVHCWGKMVFFRPGNCLANGTAYLKNPTRFETFQLDHRACLGVFECKCQGLDFIRQILRGFGQPSYLWPASANFPDNSCH